MRPLFVDALAPKEIRMLGGRVVVRERSGSRAELASFDVQKPKKQYDSIAVSGRNGWMSFEAKNFLNAFGIPVYWLDVDGKLLGVDVPNSANASDRRQAFQFAASQDAELRLQTAKSIIGTKLLLDGDDEKLVEKLDSLKELNTIESRAADRRFRKLFGTGFTRKNQLGKLYRAKDRTNCLLNYAFGIAKGQARRLIIGNSLNLSVGFVHNYNAAFLLDCEEWYRWSAQQAVAELIGEGRVGRNDFHVASDYTHTLSPFSSLKRELMERIGSLEESRRFALGAFSVGFDQFVQGRLDALVRSWGYVPILTRRK